MQVYGNEGIVVADTDGKVAAINWQSTLYVLIWDDIMNLWNVDNVTALPEGVETFEIHHQEEGATVESFEWEQYEFVANNFYYTITPEPATR